MAKQKRWQFWIIVAALVLTIYNILPTVFYYTKPLKKPIGAKQAEEVAQQITTRVNNLEQESVEWLKAYCKNLKIKPTQIKILQENPRYIAISFNDPNSVARFNRYIAKAGAMIPFVPAQLQPAALNGDYSGNTIYLARQLNFSFPKNSDGFFTFAEKLQSDGLLTPELKETTYQRLAPLAVQLAGQSDQYKMMQTALTTSQPQQSAGLCLTLAKDIVAIDNFFGDQSSIAKRFFASFTQFNGDAAAKRAIVQRFQELLTKTASELSTQQRSLMDEQVRLKSQGQFLDASQSSQIASLEQQQINLEAASLIVKRNFNSFAAGLQPLTHESVLASLNQQSDLTGNSLQTLDLNGLNPFIQTLTLDWSKDSILLTLYSDVQSARFQENPTETESRASERLNQMISDEVALLARVTHETVLPASSQFSVALSGLTNSHSFLTLNLAKVAQNELDLLQGWLKAQWQPRQVDLKANVYPILNYSEYQDLPAAQQKLALVLYAPSATNAPIPTGMRSSSIYVIAKGLARIAKQYENQNDSLESTQLMEDFGALSKLMQQEGFFGYPASIYGFGPEFENDYIFEQDHFYDVLLKATRENFVSFGRHSSAILEFTDLEQRILTLNKIEDSMHESLLRWRDEYQAAQVNLNVLARYEVPPPVKNVFLDNMKLSFKKYFRGDTRKILRWGLDLSGGKTVRIGLKDQQGRPVTNQEDLRQGLNELYKRVNKMGVSEVGMRLEGDSIVLDFPGSQGLSAQELVKASSMTFHVVNEKFTPQNPALSSAVSQFLQQVWNEAVVSNKKDIDSINQIAWQHLGSGGKEGELVFTSDAAKTLYEQGLRLAAPGQPLSSSFDDSLSSLALFKGDEYADWEGQPFPLLIVFHNYALAGTSLDNVQVGYDPSKGNILSFGVKGTYTLNDGQKVNARDDFYNWTSQFCQEKIGGTPKETQSNGRGWRMAVILNDQIVSSPTLSEPLREHAMISGHFSQREINQLAADLKAGSLTFTPKILSEQNVSPELGHKERLHGIMAAGLAAIAVVIVMIAYYRFAGLVASVAIFFNLLIMWGVLQNLDAALTLPGIAGIILTIGMAVDANVLVYERVREEFEVSKRLASALNAGYRKAFSAIFDSNITTIIAALILLQFDSGPIKSFAVMLIIGIISSMFTALFMTRTFFGRWVQNPEHKQLTMAKVFTRPNFDFLKWTKISMIASLAIIVIGCGLLGTERRTLFGMDFTGGYALVVDLQEQPAVNYREKALTALIDNGVPSTNVQIRELNRPNALRIQLGMGLEEAGMPFAGMPQQVDSSDFVYKYQENPRINWVIQTLANSGLQVKGSDLTTLDHNWTQMSGQLSDTMRNNALWGLLLSLICILIYLTIRFEFKYAISSILGLLHDVLITVGILALLHAMGIAIQIDMQVIAALMTIIGYSLNDTIIIFDRIREDTRLMRKMKFTEIVNHALNATLSRTMMTSGTTLVVLLILMVFAGPTIFSFATVMTIGVVVGTLSSLFVATPLLVYFHNKEKSKKSDQSVTLHKA